MLDPLDAKLALLCAAVFHAEGFWVPGSLPRRHNNPGDMLDHAGQHINYPDRIAGTSAAAWQLAMMLTGRSHIYHAAMTWRRVAQLWTGGDNWQGWCASVCDDLGVSPDSTLGDFAGVELRAPAPVAN